MLGSIRSYPRGGHRLHLVGKGSKTANVAMPPLALGALGSVSGRYRRENGVISGASTIPPDFLHLQEEMVMLIDWYQNASAVHPIERAAELHTRFVKTGS